MHLRACLGQFNLLIQLAAEIDAKDMSEYEVLAEPTAWRTRRRGGHEENRRPHGRQKTAKN